MKMVERGKLFFLLAFSAFGVFAFGENDRTNGPPLQFRRFSARNLSSLEDLRPIFGRKTVPRWRPSSSTLNLSDSNSIEIVSTRRYPNVIRTSTYTNVIPSLSRSTTPSTTTLTPAWSTTTATSYSSSTSTIESSISNMESSTSIIELSPSTNELTTSTTELSTSKSRPTSTDEPSTSTTDFYETTTMVPEEETTLELGLDQNKPASVMTQISVEDYDVPANSGDLTTGVPNSGVVTTNDEQVGVTTESVPNMTEDFSVEDSVTELPKVFQTDLSVETTETVELLELNTYIDIDDHVTDVDKSVDIVVSDNTVNDSDSGTITEPHVYEKNDSVDDSVDTKTINNQHRSGNLRVLSNPRTVLDGQKSITVNDKTSVDIESRQEFEGFVGLPNPRYTMDKPGSGFDLQVQWTEFDIHDQSMIVKVHVDKSVEEVRLRYLHFNESVREFTESDGLDDAHVVIVPMDDVSHDGEVVLHRLDHRGWYILCGEAIHHYSVLDTKCVKTKANQTESLPIISEQHESSAFIGETSLIIIGVVVGVSVIIGIGISYFVYITLTKKRERIQRDNSLRRRVERKAQRERELADKHPWPFDSVYVDPEQPFEERCIM